MKTLVLKNSFRGIGRIFIGLFFSMIISYFCQSSLPTAALSLAYRSLSLSQHVHVSLIMLYRSLIWFIMELFRGKLLPKRLEHSCAPSLATLMILTFALFLPTQLDSSHEKKILSLTLTAVGEFTLIYLIISGAIYHTYRKRPWDPCDLSSKS